ncbi:MAG: hypothetical protein MJZ32_02890 [Bacteroidaceae bacterium]|nr:hypothetical protein [Bacteroidaceae bacterium]
MNTFNFSQYKSLLRYSMVENKRNYMMAFGIGVLAYTLIGIFFFNILPSGGLFLNYEGADMQGELEAMSITSTVIFGTVMTFVITQFELVNRYCLQREAMQYNLLPASYKEKGWAILTMFFGCVIIGSLIYYLLAYIITFIYFLVFNADVTFQPFCVIGEGISEFVKSFPHEVPNGVFFSLVLFICMIPLGLFGQTLCYFVAVTYFKTKAQIKALVVLQVISNVISWAFLIVGSAIAQFADLSFLEDFFNNMNEQTALGYLYVFDAFIVILSFAIALGFGYWFFRRLHYKEIR